MPTLLEAVTSPDATASAPANSSPTAPPQGQTLLQAVTSGMQQSTPDAQQFAASQAPTWGYGLGNFLNAAVGSAVGPFKRLAERPLLAATNALGLTTQQQTNQEFNPATNPNYNVLPYDPNTIGGWLGQQVGGMAAMSNPIAAALSGSEHGIENVEQHDINAAQTGGPALSPGQVAAQVGGQGALATVLSGLTPGGQVGKKLLGSTETKLVNGELTQVIQKAILPEIDNLVGRIARNVMVHAGLGGVEAGAYQAGSNAVDIASGARPQQGGQTLLQAVTEGVPEAAGAGLVGGGILGGLHEATRSTPVKLTEETVGRAEEAAKGLKEYSQNAQQGPPVPSGSTEEAPPLSKGLPPSLEGLKPKVRMPGTAENPAREMSFDDPKELAGYMVATGRGGKLANDASQYLQDVHGMTPDEIGPFARKAQLNAEANAREGNDRVLPIQVDENEPYRIKPEDHTAEDHAQSATFQKLGQDKPIFYSNPDDPKAAYVNPNGETWINKAHPAGPQGDINTLAHEAMHGWQKAQPQLADQFWKNTPKADQDANAEAYKALWRQTDPNWDFRDDLHRQQEAQAMLAGKMAENPAVMDRVLRQQPGLFQRFVEWVQSKLGRGPELTPTEQAFIKTAREAISRYQQGVMEAGPSQAEGAGPLAKPGIGTGKEELEENLSPEAVRQKALLEPVRGQYDPNTKKTYWWKAAEATHDDIRKQKDILDSDVTPDMSIKVATDKRGTLQYDSNYGTHDPTDTENPFHSLIKNATANVLDQPAPVKSKMQQFRGEYAKPAPAEYDWEKNKPQPPPNETFEQRQERNKRLGELADLYTNQPLAANSDVTGQFPARNHPPMAAKPAVFQKFEDEDIKPRWTAATTGLHDSFKTMRNFLGLQGFGGEGQEGATVAKNLFRFRGAELANRYDRMHAALDETRDIMNRTMDVPAQRDFIDNLEKGQAQRTPELDRVSKVLRGILDDRAKELSNRGFLGNYIQNYFPHIWSDYNKAESFYARIPLEGDKGFLKARTLPTQADGIAAGLTPLFENPIEAVLHRVHSMDKFLTAHDVFNSLGKDGLLQQMNARDPVAEGYAKIDDKIARIYAPPSRKGAVQEWKRFDAPEAVASVINNYTDPGMLGKPGAAPLRSLLGIGNVMNMAQLGLSGFHASMTAGNSIISSVANGLRDIRAGEIGQGLKSIATSPIAPIRDYVTGSRIQKEWANPGSTDSQTAQLVQLLKQGGGRANKDLRYDNGFYDAFKRAASTGNYIGAGLRAPLAIFEKAAAPIMEHLVPKLKLGAFAEDVQRSIRDSPDTSAKSIMTAAGNSWDSIDNRFGQLIYDNVFWNKTLKQGLQLGTRSVGWNLGTVRELGGGLADIARGAGTVKPLTSRAGYVIALPAVTALAGGLISKLVYNQDPQDAKDLFYPRTGEKDKQGRDVRIALPTYMKDVYSYGTHPISTLEHKSGPLINSMLEVMKNEDFYGHQIVDPRAGLADELAQAGKYAGTQLVPFSLRSGQQEPSLGRRIGQATGFIQASADVERSEAEQEAQDRTRRWDTGPITEAEAAKFKAKTDLRERMAGLPPSQRRAAAIEGVHQGTITGKGISDLLQQSALPSLLERQVAHFTKEGQAGMENALAVYDKGTPEEKAKLRTIILAHLNTAQSLPYSEKQAIRSKLNGPQ